MDGNDVATVSRACLTATRQARSGKGPQFIEMVTYRWRGHVGHREDLDVGVKRKDDLNLWKKRDPISRLAKGMEKKKWLQPHEVKGWKEKAEKVVSKAWDQAAKDPYPKPEALLGRVFYQGSQR